MVIVDLKKKSKVVLTIGILVVALSILIAYKKNSGTSKLLEAIGGYKGYSREISKEEYEFYEYFVKRDLAEDKKEELEALTKAYAERVNAVFYLGNKLGFCKPYSFESLKSCMEQENTERKVKLEKGEMVYGLQQFTLENYFQYELGNLETNICGYLEENLDRQLEKEAKDYYEANKEMFRGREAMTYEVTIEGVTETVTADSDQLSLLNKADMGLADFLNAAEIGETYTDLQNGQERTVVLKEINYTKDGYRNNKQMAISTYVREILYGRVIETVIQNNPAEFEKN